MKRKILLLAICMSSMIFEGFSQAAFTGNCGETSQHDKKISGVLPVGQTISMNGSTDLSSCIKGNNDSYVAKVSLQEPGVVEDYKVVVEGRGPSGIGNGSFYLRFFDETGDYYDLSLWSHDYESHEVSYDSDKPTITAVMWSDYAFPTDYCTICDDVVSEALTKALDESSGCAELVTEFGIECDAAMAGPEDILGDIICAAAGYALDDLCDEMSFGWIKNNIAEASSRICQSAHFCK